MEKDLSPRARSAPFTKIKTNVRDSTAMLLGNSSL